MDSLNERRLSFIRKFQSDSQHRIHPYDLYDVEMGKIICLYVYARNKKDEKYTIKAEKLLDKRIENIPQFSPLSPESKILGFACGLIYLLRNHYINENEYEILEEIDTFLINNIYSTEDFSQCDWAGIIHYFHLRITAYFNKKYILYNLIIRHILVYLLGQLRYCSFDTIIFDEINNFHQIKICPRNTNEILNREYKTNTLIQKHNIKMEERTTFIIPVRIDSHQRELNLDFLLERLSSIENINIFICEADLEPLYKVKKEYDNVSYFFYQDPSPVFHRTKYLNIMIKKSKNEIVAIWDTDAFVPNSQINKAINEIRIGNAVMSFPYDGHFYMLSPEDSNACMQTGSFDFLHNKLDQLFLPHGPHSVGGAFIINKHMYLEAGGENENFYGWGPEDVERVMRIEILGLPITYTKGPLFHLYHPRMKNSKFTNDKLEIRNRSEYLKICSMDQSELYQYIQSWSCL